MAGVGADEIPVAPGESHKEIGIGTAYPRIRSGQQHGPHLIVAGDVALIESLQVGPRDL